jgi:DNA-binding beta-propeller fold protein YncE
MTAAAYEPLGPWGRLPPGLTLDCDVPAVAVDRSDNVYVFNRGPHPMLVFDRDGNFLRAWGEGLFKRPHGLHVGPDDCLYCTDEGDHTVRKCTPDGRVLLTLGVPGRAAPYMGGEPFNRCTHTALAPNGDIYVSDGYGNACIHRYDPAGRLLMTWGEPGIDPGQFNIAHNVCCDSDGWVYVADRENHRVQIFAGDGRFETQWSNLHRPCGLCLGRDSAQQVHVSELAPTMPVNLDIPNLGPRVTVMKRDGTRAARFGAPGRGQGPGQFISPHGIAVDSRGDVYVGEVSYTVWPRISGGAPVPGGGFRTLQKWRRTA